MRSCENLPKTSEVTSTLQEYIGVTNRGLLELKILRQASRTADISCPLRCPCVADPLSLKRTFEIVNLIFFFVILLGFIE